jgi:hypothetical protein
LYSWLVSTSSSLLSSLLFLSIILHLLHTCNGHTGQYIPYILLHSMSFGYSLIFTALLISLLSLAHTPSLESRAHI